MSRFLSITSNEKLALVLIDWLSCWLQLWICELMSWARKLQGKPSEVKVKWPANLCVLRKFTSQCNGFSIAVCLPPRIMRKKICSEHSFQSSSSEITLRRPRVLFATTSASHQSLFTKISIMNLVVSTTILRTFSLIIPELQNAWTSSQINFKWNTTSTQAPVPSQQSGDHYFVL